MKKAVTVILVLGTLAFIMFYDFQGKDIFLKTIVIIIPMLFLLNIFMRNSLKFKNYFTSRYNIFTSKYRYSEAFDLSEDLLFDKVSEVVAQSNYKVSGVNKNRHQILLTTGFSLSSWGENVYIEVKTVGNKTVMNLCSVTFFQIVSWGKNRKNIRKLTGEIESSFII